MKYFYKTIFLVIFLSLILIGFLVFSKNYSIKNTSEPIKSSDMEYTYSPNIYYVNSDYLLVSKKIEVNVRGNNIFFAMFEVMKNPPEKFKNPSVINKKAKLKSAILNGRTLTLDFSFDLIKSEYWETPYYNSIVYSIVNTYTSFDTIDRVIIKIEGTDLSEYVIPVNYRNTGMIFNESMIYSIPKKPEELVRTFFNYIEIERYDLAYQLTKNSYNYVMNDVLFHEEVDKKLNMKSNSFRDVVGVKKTFDYYIVEVSVNCYDEDGMVFSKCNTEYWKVVVMPDNSFKLVFFSD